MKPRSLIGRASRVLAPLSLPLRRVRRPAQLWSRPPQRQIGRAHSALLPATQPAPVSQCRVWHKTRNLRVLSPTGLRRLLGRSLPLPWVLLTDATTTLAAGRQDRPVLIS